MKKIMIALLVLGALFPSSSWCGTGTYVAGDPDGIQLSVSFEYDEGNTDDWKPLFIQASRLLFDATEKQVKISKVAFYKQCPSMANQVDVRIFKDDEGANSNVGGLGRQAARIRLSQIHKTVTTSGAGDRGQFGLVHEMGHYVFGLLDEYLDKNENTSNDAYCIDPRDNTSATIMDGGTTVRVKNTRTEFCSSKTHRAGKTAQDKQRPIGSKIFEDASDWTWIPEFVHERYGATLTAPAERPVHDPAGFDGDPVFDKVVDCGLKVSGLKVSVGVDSSGSMSARREARREDGVRAEAMVMRSPGRAPIDLAKQGAGKFLRLLQQDDSVGIVTGEEGTHQAPLLQSRDIDKRFRSLSMLPALEARGQTSWTQVLEDSVEQLAGEAGGTGGESTAAPGVVVLLSDGGRSGEEAPEPLVTALKKRNVVVHAIGIDGDGQANLRRIASETGGSFIAAETAPEMDAGLMAILAQVKSEGIIAAEQDRIKGGATRVVEVPVDEATAKEAADFLLTWSEGERALGLRVIAPDGRSIRAEEPNAVFQEDLDRKLKRYRILHPATGTWKVEISNPGAGTEGFAFQVHALTSAVTISSYAESDILAFPAPMVLRTVVGVDDPVGGASVVARIDRPSGEPVTLELFDDGSGEHGDDRANDGTYSNIFKDYRGSGSYTVDVTVNSKDGYTVSPREEGGRFTSRAVAPFTRKARFTAVVQGAPD